MTYRTKEAKAARRKLDDKLIDLYISCKTFNEFRLKALQMHAYRCYCFDPFWRAYMMILHPVLYWCCVHAAFAILSALLSWLLVVVFGSCYWLAAFPMFWIIGFHVYIWNVGYYVIQQILLKEGVSSEIY